MAQYTVPQTTNYIAITNDVEAPNANYKCFVKFLAESCISGALTANPIIYLDLLEQFWASAVVEEMALEDATVSYTIFCKF